MKWQIVLGSEAAVKHTYFLFHTFFTENCVDSLQKICFYFSGTAHNLFVKICKVISENSHLFIQWPQPEEYADLAGLNGFPDTLGTHWSIFLALTYNYFFLGFIDGSFIPIIKPKNSGESYFNRKKFYSVTLQAVCTGDLRIIDVSVGYPSSMNDKRVLNVAPLEEVA